jgi:hypothetical protein
MAFLMRRLVWNLQVRLFNFYQASSINLFTLIQFSFKFLQSQPFYELFHKLYIVQDNYIVYYSLQFSYLPFRAWRIPVFFKSFLKKKYLCISSWPGGRQSLSGLRPEELTVNNNHDVGTDGREAQS